MIILVKTPIIDTIESIIKRNEILIEASLKTISEKPEFRLQENESLMIPKIEFDLEHHFKEMIGQDLYVDGEHADYFIAEAVQFIKFILNEEGAKLRSEMAIFARCISLINEKKPRQFIFDKPFLIYLKEKDSPLYFAAWIANSEILKIKK